jgi:hypothetical protein
MRTLAGFALFVALAACGGSATPESAPSPPPATETPTGTPTATRARAESGAAADAAEATVEVRYPWDTLVVSRDGRTLTVRVPYYGQCDVFSRITVDESLRDGTGQRTVLVETYKRRPATPGADCERRTDAPTTHTVRLREPLGGREVVQRTRPAPVPPGSSPDPSAETS